MSMLEWVKWVRKCQEGLRDVFVSILSRLAGLVETDSEIGRRASAEVASHV
jgi:hypothetical protein